MPGVPQPRPFYDRFKQLMDRIDTMSIWWWAQAHEACRTALLESRAARLVFDHSGLSKGADEIAELQRREQELACLAERFAQLKAQHQIPPKS